MLHSVTSKTHNSVENKTQINHLDHLDLCQNASSLQLSVIWFSSRALFLRCLLRILMIHLIVSLAKSAALKRAMKTPHRMATELQGFAVTICFEMKPKLRYRLTHGYGHQPDEFWGGLCVFGNLPVGSLAEKDLAIQRRQRRADWFSPVQVFCRWISPQQTRRSDKKCF